MTEVRIFKPFVHHLKPSFYPRVAQWYVERESLFMDVEQACRSLNSGDLEERLRQEAVLNPLRSFLDEYMELTDREEEGLALEELRHYARFFREVKAQIGCAGRPLAERMRQDLQELFEQYQDLIRPEAVIGSYPCRFDEEGVSIQGFGKPIRSRSLLRFYTTPLKTREDEEYDQYETEKPLFVPPEACYLFAATIGPGVDKEVGRLSGSGESYQALLLNGIGAGAADMVAYDLELYVNRDHSEKNSRWRRFHVGYGDFKLEEQRRLFAVLDPGRIGIELNPSCIMIPEKSVSGILALKRSR